MPSGHGTEPTALATGQDQSALPAGQDEVALPAGDNPALPEATKSWWVMVVPIWSRTPSSLAKN